MSHPAWPGDDTLGPRVPGHPDLTLPFENVMLCIVPAITVIILTPRALREAVQGERIGKVSLTLCLEISLLSSVFAAELNGIDQWRSLPSPPPWALLSSSLLCVASVCVAGVLVAGRAHGCWPLLPTAYAATTVLFDLIRVRSFVLRDMRHSAIVCMVTALLKCLLVMSGHVSLLLQDRQALLRSQSIFAWTISTLWIGGSDTVQMKDMPQLDTNGAEALFASFQIQWAKVDKKSRSPLLRACISTLEREIVQMWPYLLAFSAFTFSQPFMIRQITWLVENGRALPHEIGKMTAITAILFMGIGISKGYYGQLCSRVSALVRGILVSAIFEKSLQLDCDVNDRDARKLMNEDLTTIDDMPARACDLGVCFLQFSLGMLLLCSYVGVWCCTVFIPCGFITLLTIKMTYSQLNRNAWSDSVGHRVAATTNALTQMTAIRAMGLAPKVSTSLQELHAAEIKSSLSQRRLNAVASILDVLTESLTPMLVLMGSISWLAYPTFHSPSEAFTIMSIISLITYAMLKSMREMPRLASAVVCFDMVEKFLLQPAAIASTNALEKPSVSEPGHLRTWNSTAELRNATLLHPQSLTPVLQNVSMQLTPGGVTMMYSSAPAGKSALMRVLLGEKRLNDGTMSMPQGSIGYCDDTPWIISGDVQQNIVGQHNYDEEWYKRLLWACSISELAGGTKADDSEGWSAAQLHGIQLARAAYGKPNLLVLDDPCRRLDDETSSIMLDRLFGPGGVMRLLGITIVMTTSNPSHLAVADVAYELDGRGSADMIERPIPASSTLELPPATPLENQAQDVLDSRKISYDVWLYWFLFESGGWRVTLTASSLIFWTAVSQRFPPVYLRLWLASGFENKSCFVGYSILTAAPIVLSIIPMSLVYFKFVPKVSRKIHQSLLTTVFDATLTRLAKTSSIDTLINHFSLDLSLVTLDMPPLLFEVLYLSVMAFCDILIVLSCNSIIINFVVLFPAAVAFLQHHYLGLHDQLRGLIQKGSEPLLAHFEHSTRGIIHIRAMGLEPIYQERCQKLVDDALQPRYAASAMHRWLHLVIDVFIAAVATMCVATSLCLADGRSETAIGLTLLNLVSFGSVISRLFDSWIDLQAPFAALHRVRQFTEKTKYTNQSNHQRKELEQWNPNTGKLDMYAITVGFDESPPGIDEVRNVSMQIPHGSKVALVGPHGCGTSSLFLAVLRLVDAAGSICIDGLSIETIAPETLRSKIIMLRRDGPEMPGSIRQNLDPWSSTQRCFSDAEINAVLERLDLVEVVQSRGGLSADFASARLSKGEKQLLFLARAILRKEYHGLTLVLIDDIAGNLDGEMAARIQQVVETNFRDCTVVAGTSRIDTLKNMHRIAQMDDGRIINIIDRPGPTQQVEETRNFDYDY